MNRLGRIAEYLITVWIILSLNFFLPRMMPGDPFLYIASDQDNQSASYSKEQMDYYAHYYGLDRPLGVCYLEYLNHLAHGRLGESLYYGEPVLSLLAKRLPWTLFLVLSAVACSTILGTALGAVSAFYRNRWPDQVIYGAMMFVSEVPAFLIGLLLLFVFAAVFGLFPLSGARTPFFRDTSFFMQIPDILHHAVLPIAALTFARLGGMYLLARNSLITIIPKDYMRTARAKNLSRTRIVLRHAVRNALLPIVTRIFLSLGTLVGGAVLVENVFNYPGLGTLISEAVTVHDYPLIQGLFLLVTLLVLTLNLAAERVYRLLDPRIENNSPPAALPGATHYKDKKRHENKFSTFLNLLKRLPNILSPVTASRDRGHLTIQVQKSKASGFRTLSFPAYLSGFLKAGRRRQIK